MTTDVMIEEIERLRADGWDWWDIVRTIGGRPNSIAKRLERAGRRDLARPFENLEPRRPWRRAA